MKVTEYPRLQQIYVQRAEALKKRNLWLSLGSLTIVILHLLTGLPTRPKSQYVFAIIVLILIVSGARLVSLVYGLRNFHIAWRGQFQKLDALSQERCAAVEEVLKGDCVTFKEIVLTSNYLIAFKQLGSFARIRAIELIELEEHVHKFGIFHDETSFTLTCLIDAPDKVLLSNDEKEMPDILDEIRSRYPEVPLNPEARWRFFPPEGWTGHEV
jgi:hypothetical protein